MQKIWLCQAHYERQKVKDLKSIADYRVHKTRCELCELEQAFGAVAKAMRKPTQAQGQ